MTLISQPYSLRLFIMLIKTGVESSLMVRFGELKKTAREIGKAIQEIEPMNPERSLLEDF